jgi:peptidoglycan/LPS O-acetylase OafA/YrhL
MPWFSISGFFFPITWRKSDTETDWAKNATYQSIQILILTLLWFALMLVFGDFLSYGWFQLLNVFCHLDIVVCLVRAKGTSLCTKVLQNPIVLWFGEISMSLYLIHEPLIHYLAWIMQGKRRDWPTDTDCTIYDDGTLERTNCEDALQEFNDALLMPNWGIAVVPVVAISCAAILYYGVEEPVRKYFK